MSIDRDAPLKICWAYNKDGLRCMQPAGHAGNHAHAIEWPDEECYSPIVHQLPQRKARTLEEVFAEDEDEGFEDDAKCLVCSHPMHRRLCGLGGCDCKAGIPA